MPDESSDSVAQSAALEPLAVPAAEAARVCGVSRALWWKLEASGRCPPCVRLGRRKLWRVDELRQWVEAGCPPRSKTAAERYRRQAGQKLIAVRNKRAGQTTPIQLNP